MKNFSAPVIDLEWERDGDGYELLPEEPAPPPRPGDTLLTQPVSMPRRIVARGGRAIAYAPMALDDSLYAQLASVRTDKDALGFVIRYGMLEHRRGHYEEVSDVLQNAAACRFFLSEGRHAVEKSGEWRFGQVDLVLAQDPASGALRLRLKPPTLLAAIWLQLGQKLTRPFRECRYCGGWFETGPGTSRRADAEFCTSEHQQTFNSRKRSKRGQNHV